MRQSDQIIDIRISICLVILLQGIQARMNLLFQLYVYHRSLFWILR